MGKRQSDADAKVSLPVGDNRDVHGIVKDERKPKMRGDNKDVRSIKTKLIGEISR